MARNKVSVEEVLSVLRDLPEDTYCNRKLMHILPFYIAYLVRFDLFVVFVKKIKQNRRLDFQLHGCQNDTLRRSR